MTELELIVYSDSFLSIRDNEGDLLLHDLKWNFLFSYLNSNSDFVYFKGGRLWVDDDDFDATVKGLAENIILEDKDSFNIFLKLKPVDWQFNRNLVSKLWEYYEFPSLIFITSQNESDMVDLIKGKFFVEDVIKGIDEIVVLSRQMELNVLWINGNLTETDLAFEIKKIIT